MIRISAKEALKTIDSAKVELGPRRFSQAISRALNESILQGRTVARRAVKEHYNIPQRYVRGVDIIRSTSFSLTAKLFAKATPLPMDAFSPKFETATTSFTISRRGEQRSRQRRRVKKKPRVGVSIEVVKGSRQIVPYAFMIKGGKPRVFARGEYRKGTSHGFVQRIKRVNKEGNDIPVKPLLSVTVHTAVINNKAMGQIEGRVRAVYPTSIKRNIDFMVSRVRGANQ